MPHIIEEKPNDVNMQRVGLGNSSTDVDHQSPLPLVTRIWRHIKPRSEEGKRGQEPWSGGGREEKSSRRLRSRSNWMQCPIRSAMWKGFGEIQKRER